MSAKILVSIAVITWHLPTGRSYDHTTVSVIDSSGVPSSQDLSPAASPRQATFTVSEGVGSGTVSDFDNQGNVIGSPIPFSFDTGANSFAASGGVTVSVIG